MILNPVGVIECRSCATVSSRSISHQAYPDVFHVPNTSSISQQVYSFERSFQLSPAFRPGGRSKGDPLEIRSETTYI
jgi:hypothetical protein